MAYRCYVMSSQVADNNRIQPLIIYYFLYSPIMSYLVYANVLGGGNSGSPSYLLWRLWCHNSQAISNLAQDYFQD